MNCTNYTASPGDSLRGTSMNNICALAFLIADFGDANVMLHTLDARCSCALWIYMKSMCVST